VEKVGAQRPFVTTLAARQWLAPGILEIRLNRPAGLRFIPGQFMRFLMAGYQRDYTMVSSTDAATIDFCIALEAQGRFSDKIQKAEIGDEFQLSGPYGYFVFQGDVNPAVFVVTGTGIAPIVAFCRAGIGDALLLHGVQSSDQLIYREALASRLRGYVPCVSKAPGAEYGPSGVGFAGRVTDYMNEKLMPGVYDFYLCGRRSMIRDATGIIDRRFPDSRLFSEAYD
jgi:ferredoxin-NADP reductase